MKKIGAMALALVMLAMLSLPVSAMSIQEISTLDLRTPSGYTIKQLESGLLKGLSPLSDQFIYAEKYYGVNAVFLAAVSALESGWGQSGWSKYNNIFGYGNKMRFESKAQCIFTVSGAISRNYLSPDGRYFKGYTVDAVNRYYNGRDEWSSAVKGIMRDIVRRIERSA